MFNIYYIYYIYNFS